MASKLCQRVSHRLGRLRSPTRRSFWGDATKKRLGNGTFGLQLHKANDFSDLSQRTITRCDEIRSALAISLKRVEDGQSLPSEDTLLLLDSISNEVCSVIDMAELCRNIHDDQVFRQAAEDAFRQLSAYIHELNTDPTLYKSLMTLFNDDRVWNALNEEQQRVAEDLRKEFEQDGIHRQGTEGAVRISQLQHEIVENESLFMQNISSAPDVPFTVGPFANENYGRQLRAWLAQYSHQDTSTAPLVGVSGEEEVTDGVFAVCSSRRPVTRSVLASVGDSRVRQQAWRGGLGQPEANEAVLGRLVRMRQALATELGYPSWAHKMLASSAAGSPAEVWSLLENAVDTIQGPAEQVLQQLSALKPQGSGPLQPWDIAYYSGEFQSGRSSGSSHADAYTSAAQYFPLSNTVAALQDVTEQLFGIRLEAAPLEASEDWVGRGLASGMFQGKGDFSVKNAQGRPFKLLVHDQAGESLGCVLIDLFQRPGKFTGAAHFTVRCGCKVLCDEQYQQLREGKETHTEKLSYHGISSDASQQLPLVALAFNFLPSPSGDEPLLGLNELSTLFHEWGHALHSLLSRTTYQHLSGTRGALDFVEVPSHLFEYFASEPALLHRWGRHHATGQAAPAGFFEEALQQHRSTEALEVQSQLLYSLCDQYAFGERIGDMRAINDTEVYRQVVAGAAELQMLHAPQLPLVKDLSSRSSGLPDLQLLGHSHFVTYGGSYYSYLFAKMYAAQIWELRFKGDPLNRESGNALWKGLLINGVSRPPQKMLSEVCGGKELDPSYYFDHII